MSRCPIFLPVAASLALFATQGCDQMPSVTITPKTDASSTPTPAVPKAKDPAAALRDLANAIPQGKPFKLAADDMENWHNLHTSYDPAVYSTYEYSYTVASIDVRKTDSLMSPYIGIMVLKERLDSPTNKNWPRSPIRITLVWQNDRWIAKLMETLYPSGAEVMKKLSHPEIRMLTTVVPVEWQLE